jgi:hypothetical protein
MGLAQNSMTHCTMKLQVWDLSSYRASFLALAPFVFIKDWRNVGEVLDRLLQDPDRLKRLHLETLQWWNSRLSPTALADFVVDVLRKRACKLMVDGCWFTDYAKVARGEPRR